MCRVQSQRQPELSQSSVDKTARKVVRKYRRMTLRREMKRLRRIVLEEGERRVSSGQLLERTVSLIEELEARLVTQLRAGQVPEVIRRRGVGLQWDQLGVDTLRELMGDIMGDIMDIRGDTRHQDTDLDEVFYLEEEEEEEGFPLQHFNSDKSHICVGQYKQ